MSKYTQEHRPLAVATPLGDDALLLNALRGREAVSELFEFRLDLLAEKETAVPFGQVLGQPVAVAIRTGRGEGEVRYVHGLVSEFGEGGEVRGPEGETTFVRYSATVVPHLWLLTRQTASRIFQQQAVPDILKAVFDGLKVSWNLVGTYEPRDYCVQYRETSFAFASRLMEEEGISYYFQHAWDGHTLVVSDNPNGHAPLPFEPALIYEAIRGGLRPEERVTAWRKTQRLRSGRVTLWDRCFEMPDNNLESQAVPPKETKVGTVAHPSAVGPSESLELYDYPGEYARRFDGIAPGGTERSKEMEKIFSDNVRTAKIRMEQEAAQGIVADGEGTCRQLTAGHGFTLERHFNADGPYVALSVEHRASNGIVDEAGYPGGTPVAYSNTFRAIPAGLPYRPPRTTPRAHVWGTQTATVVGPAGEEIFTDKYGRVKVQFHWDRQGKYDEGSSCWVRVSQVHAGKGWGGIDVPRVGEELVVAFEEGDPDQPIAIGRVYNAERMPPFGLPDKRMKSGLKSNTYPSKGGGSNEISMDDSDKAQRMYVHAQHDQDEVVRNNQTSHVMKNRTKTVDVDETTVVGNNRKETVGVDETIEVKNNRTETVGADESVTVVGNQALAVGIDRTETVGANHARTVGSNLTESVVANHAQTVGADQTVTVTGNQALTVATSRTESVGLTRTTSVGVTDTVNVGLVQTVSAGLAITISAGVTLTLAAPGGTIVISPSGIEITGKKIVIQGDTVHINP